MDDDDKDRTFALGRRSDRTYFTGQFANDPNKRFAIRVWDGEGRPRFEWVRSGKFVAEPVPDRVHVREEAVIGTTPHGTNRYQLKALLLEDSRDIEYVVIQQFTERTGKPHAAHIALSRDEVDRLLAFFRLIRIAPLPDETKHRMDDRILDDLLDDAAARVRFLRENPRLAELLGEVVHTRDDLDAETLARLVRTSGRVGEVLQHIVDAGLDEREVVAVAHRRRQLDIFERLLRDPDHFAATRREWNCGPEQVWQRFFESNTWILGYGLQYRFGQAVGPDGLEQVVRGNSLAGPGKRVDALLKTLGAISSLCFVEIKTHDTDLLARRAYRPGVHPPSTELAGAVSQVQMTVQAAVDNFRSALRPTDEGGTETGEILHNLSAKALVICGSLTEFKIDDRINTAKVKSFELFRRSLHNPEIITFDELYERARFIVEGDERRPSRVEDVAVDEDDADAPPSFDEVPPPPPGEPPDWVVEWIAHTPEDMPTPEEEGDVPF